MSDREIRDRITSLEAAIVRLDQRLIAVTAASRDLAQGCLALIERVKRIEDRLGMEA